MFKQARIHGWNTDGTTDSDFMKTLLDEDGLDILAVRRMMSETIRAPDQRDPFLLDVGARLGGGAIMAAQSGCKW